MCMSSCRARQLCGDDARAGGNAIAMHPLFVSGSDEILNSGSNEPTDPFDRRLRTSCLPLRRGSHHRSGASCGGVRAPVSLDVRPIQLLASPDALLCVPVAIARNCSPPIPRSSQRRKRSRAPSWGYATINGHPIHPTRTQFGQMRRVTRFSRSGVSASKEATAMGDGRRLFSPCPHDANSGGANGQVQERNCRRRSHGGTRCPQLPSARRQEIEALKISLATWPDPPGDDGSDESVMRLSVILRCITSVELPQRGELSA